MRNVVFKEPTLGDHLFVIAELELESNVQTKTICKRNWRNYSKDSLILYPNVVHSDIQSRWNAESLFLGVLKEDLFYFFFSKLIFLGNFYFHYTPILYSLTMSSLFITK